MRSDPAFDRFLRARDADLRRIARATRGESTLDDVRQQAWVQSRQLHSARGIPPDYADTSYQETLLRFLYQELVRYTEQNVRHAERLDHWDDADGAGDVHPIARRLAAPEGTEPMAALLAKEAASQEPPMLSVHHSRAAAWVVLLRSLDNRMRDVASHLLISVSYCYQCYGKALRLAREQTPMPDTLGVRYAIEPRAWRKYRMLRPPAQYALDFGPEPALWTDPEMPGAEEPGSAAT